MIVIRKAQMDFFADLSKRRMADRCAEALRKDFPRQTAGLGPVAVRDRILRGINAADQFGLRTERQILAFVHLGFLWGEKYYLSDKFRWAFEILNSLDVAADERVRLLQQRSERLIAAIERRRALKGSEK